MKTLFVLRFMVSRSTQKPRFLFAGILALAFTVSGVLAQIPSPVPPGAKIELVVGGLSSSEGPLWHPDGFLLISEYNSNRILKIDPKTGAKEVFLNPSGGANGLSFDRRGNVIICQMYDRRVSRLEADGSLTVLASQYNGKKFNSPNDLSIKSDGTIFFTDPYYSGLSPTPRELSFDGIYCLKPDGEVKLLEKNIASPSGICFSPDEKRLYVNDTFSGTVYVFDVENNWTLANRRVFATISVSGGWSDGMKVDQNGLLYVTGPGSIWIFSPDGKVVDKISLPGNGQNVNWGDADYQTLYIASLQNVFKIRLNTKGFISGVDGNDTALPDDFELLQNYPNPFNPTTTIAFTLPASGQVKLSVYDLLGREAVTLVDGRLNAGQHHVTFNGSSLTSGVYFYRLEAGEQIKTRRLLLVK